MTEKYIPYKVGEDIYDIPESKSADFEKKFPSATIEMHVGEDIFDIPLQHKDSFLKQYSDATYAFDKPEAGKFDLEIESAAPELPAEAPSPSLANTEAANASAMAESIASKETDDEVTWGETIANSVASIDYDYYGKLLNVGTLSKSQQRGSITGLVPALLTQAWNSRDIDELILDEEDTITKERDRVGELKAEAQKAADPTGGTKGYMDLIREGDFENVAQKGIGDAIQSLPTTLAAKNKYTMLANMALMALDNYVEDTKENPETAKWKRATHAIATAAFEQIVEKYSDPLFKYFKGGKKMASEVTEEAAKEMFEKGTKKVADRIFDGLEKLGKFTLEVGKSARDEGLEEVVTAFGNDMLGNALDLMSGDEDYGFIAQWKRLKEENPDASLWDFAQSKAKEYIDSFIGGAASGGYMSGSAQTVADTGNYITKKQSESRLKKSYKEGASLGVKNLYDVNKLVTDAQDAVEAIFTDIEGNSSLSREFIDGLSAEQALELANSDKVSSYQSSALKELAKRKALSEGLNTGLGNMLTNYINGHKENINKASENGNITVGVLNGNAVYVKGGVVNNGAVTLADGSNGPVIVYDINTGAESTANSNDIKQAQQSSTESYINYMEKMLTDNHNKTIEMWKNTMSPFAKKNDIKQYAGKKIVINSGNGLAEVRVESISEDGQVVLKGKKGDLGGQSVLEMDGASFYDAIHRDENGNAVIVENNGQEIEEVEEETAQPVVQEGPQDYREQTVTILINGVPVEVEVTGQDDTADRITYEYTDANGRRKSGGSTIRAFQTAIQQAAQLQPEAIEEAPVAEPVVEEAVETAPVVPEAEVVEETAEETMPLEPESINWDELFVQDPESYFVELQNQFGEETLDILNEEIEAAQSELDSLAKAKTKSQNERLENRKKKAALQQRINTLNDMVARLTAEPVVEETPVVEDTLVEEPVVEQQDEVLEETVEEPIAETEEVVEEETTTEEETIVTEEQVAEPVVEIVAPVAPNPVDDPIAEAKRRETQLVSLIERDGIDENLKKDAARRAGKEVADMFATRKAYEEYEAEAADLGEYVDYFDEGVNESFANRPQNTGISKPESVTLETESNDQNNVEQADTDGDVTGSETEDNEGHGGNIGSGRTDNGSNIAEDEGNPQSEQVREGNTEAEESVEDKYPAREGDVSAQTIKDTFGLADVTIESQHVLNAVYDVFMEMSKLLGISPKSIGHGGTLSFAPVNSRTKEAIAAQYGPWVSYYERKLKGVVLLRDKSLSSMLHEWWHSLDHTLHMYDDVFVNGIYATTVGGNVFNGRKEVHDAILAIIRAIKKSGHIDRINNTFWYNKAYYKEKKEQTARAFEQYIMGKFAEKGLVIDNVSLDNDAAQPTPEEMVVIAPAFDNLFKVLHEKEGKTTGTTVLYHIGQLMDSDSPAWRLATETAIKLLNDAGLNVIALSNEELNNLIAENPKLKSLKTADGTIYGWTDGKNIYLTEAGLNPNTPIHEYTHLWARAMMKQNPKGWKSIKNLLKNTFAWKDVLNDPNYAGIKNDEDAVASEVLSRFSGSKNAAKLEAMAQKMIDEAKGTMRKAEARGLIQNIKDALNKFWSWVGKKFFEIENFNSIDEVTDRVLYDLVNKTDLGELSEGQVETQIKSDNNLVSLPKVSEAIKTATWTKDAIDELNKTVENVEEGKAILKRYTSSELTGLLEGGSLLVGASVISRGSKGNVPSSRRRAESIEEKAAETIPAIEAWAKEIGVWRDYSERNDDEIAHSYWTSGGEAQVFYLGNGKVEKIIGLDYFIDPQLAIDRIAIHNALFPETNLKVTGFGTNKYGKFAIIVEQPTIIGKHTDHEEIDSYIESLGFDKIDDASRTFANKDLYLSDLHKENVLNQEHKRYYVIDGDFRLNTPEARIGGTREIDDSISKESSLTLQNDENISNANAGNDGRRISSETGGVQEGTPVSGQLSQNRLLYNPEGEGVSWDDYARFNPINEREGESDRKRSDREASFFASYEELSTNEKIDVYLFLNENLSRTSGSLKNSTEEYVKSIREKGNNRLADFVESFIKDELKYREGLSASASAKYGFIPGAQYRLSAIEHIFDAHNSDEYNEVLFDRAIKLAKRFGVTIGFTTRQANGDFFNASGEYDTAGNTIFIDANLLLDGNTQNLSRTILHELIHSVVSRAADITTGRAVTKDYHIIDKESLPKDVADGIHILKEVYSAIKDDNDFKGQYGVASFEEMLSEISNSKFRNLLKAKNLWKKIKDGILRILGLKEEDASSVVAFAEIESALDKILSSAERGELDAMYASYLGHLDDKYTIEDLQNLGDGDVKAMLTQNILFNTGIDPTEASKQTAAQVYDNTVDNVWQEVQRQFQDAYQPVRIAIDAIQQETGNNPIEDYENYILMQNQSSSRSRVETDTFMKKYYSPIIDQVNSVITELLLARGVDATDKAKRAEAYREVLIYIIAKHGLERNKYYQSHKTRKLTKYEKNPLLKQAKAEHDTEIAMINMNNNLTDAERKLLLREAEDAYNAAVTDINSREVADMRDYAGLTGLFGLESDKFEDAERMAQEEIDRFEAEVGIDATDKLWKRINAATDKTLRHSYESGIISRKQYNDIKGMFKFYVPLRGFDETTAEDVYSYSRFEGNRFSPAVYEAGGRTSLADDPIAYIMNMAESEIAQGNRNKAKQALYSFLLNRAGANNKQNSLMQLEDVWYIITTDENGNEVEQIATPDHEHGETYAQFEERMNKLAEEGKAAKSKKGSVDVGVRFQKARNKGSHYVYLKVNGVEKAIFINGDPKAADAINGTFAPKMSDGMAKVKTMQRILSSTFTNYSLEFTVRNYFRDMVYSHINIGVRESDPAYRKKFRQNWRHNNMGSMLKMLNAYRNGELDNRLLTEDEAAFVEFMENGGQTGYTLINSVDARKKELQKAIKRMQNGVEKGGVKDSTVFKYTLGGIELLNEASELVTRFAAYKTSRDMGRGILRSISDAKEVTVNFNTKGAQDGNGWLGVIARYLGAVKYFFNASVQGVQNLSAMAKKNKLKFGAVVCGTIALGALMPIIQGALISMLGGDEEEYWDIPEYERQNNLCFLVGGGKYVKIPLPIGFREMYGIGDLIMAGIKNKKFTLNPLTVGIDVANKIASIVLPLNPLEGAANGLSLVESAQDMLLPDATQGIIQNRTNTDYMGNPIQKEDTYNEHDAEWTKAFASNPPWLTGLSKWCYEHIDIFGVPLNFSPEHLDNTLQNTFGGIYSLIKKTGNTISMIWNEDNRKLSNVPVVGVILGTTNAERTVNSIYWEQSDDYNLRIFKIESTAKSFGLTLDDVFKRVPNGEAHAGAHHPKMSKIYNSDYFDFMQEWYWAHKGEGEIDKYGNKILGLDQLRNKIKSLETKIMKNENGEPTLEQLEELAELNKQYEDRRGEMVELLLELD